MHNNVFWKDFLSEKRLGKLHLNLNVEPISVLLLFYTLHQLSFTWAPHLKVINIFFMQMNSVQPRHISAVIVRVIENNACESLSKYRELYDRPEFECPSVQGQQVYLHIYAETILNKMTYFLILRH